MKASRVVKALLLAGVAVGLSGAATAAAGTNGAESPPLISPDIVRTIAEGGAQQKEASPLQKLEDVLRYSYEHNPALLAARESMKAVQEKMPQAAAGWRPTVGAKANVTASDVNGSAFGGGGSTSKEVEADITQPLYRGGRTVAATDSATNAILARRSLLVAQEQNAMLAVATAYMDVSRDKALRALNESNRDVIAEQLEMTKKRFDVGELTKTDVAQAQARMAAAEANLIASQGNLQKSRAAFERVTGQPAGEIGRPKLKFPVPETPEEAAAQAARNNPEVLAARFIHRSAQRDIDVAFGGLLPEISAFGSWNRQYDPQPGLTDKTTTASVGINANIPIYDAGMTRSRLREAKYTANQRYMEILDASRRVHEETVANWENLRAARAEIDSRRAQAAAAEQARDGVYKEAEVGARTTLDALDADREYLDARAALVAAERNEIVATFALAATLGLLTPEVLGFPELKGDYDAMLDAAMWKIMNSDVDIVGGGAH